MDCPPPRACRRSDGHDAVHPAATACSRAARRRPAAWLARAGSLRHRGRRRAVGRVFGHFPGAVRHSGQQVSAKATAAIAAIGYILMSALFCVYSFFGPLESCLFAASMPVVSAFLRDLGASTAKGKAAISEQALPPQALPNNADDRRQPQPPHRHAGAFRGAYRCANELARTLYIQMDIAGQRQRQLRAHSGRRARLSWGLALRSSCWRLSA